MTNSGIRPDLFVDKLISELPGLATGYRRIASLHEELPILMEAAPRPLLAALGQMLGGGGKALVPIFQDTDLLFSKSSCRLALGVGGFGMGTPIPCRDGHNTCRGCADRSGRKADE